MKGGLVLVLQFNFKSFLEFTDFTEKDPGGGCVSCEAEGRALGFCIVSRYKFI